MSDATVLTKRHKENFKQLGLCLISYTGEVQLDMEYWCRIGNNGYKLPSKRRRELLDHTCNTSCCLAGFAAGWGIGAYELMRQEQRSALDFFEYVLNVFGVDTRTSLFSLKRENDVIHALCNVTHTLRGETDKFGELIERFELFKFWERIEKEQTGDDCYVSTCIFENSSIWKKYPESK